MNRIILVFILSVYCCQLFSQATDQDAFNIPVVTFSFKTQSFDKVMPFDRPFTFHLKDIDPSFEYIRISIYENKYVMAKFRKTGEIDAKAIMDQNLVFKLQEWNKKEGPTITETDIPEGFSLRPNSSYIVSVEAGQKRGLNDAEKTSLVNALQSNRQIADAINEIAYQFIKTPDLPSTILYNNRDKIINLVSQAVTKTNKAYGFNKPDNLTTLITIAQLRNDFQNIAEHITSVHQLNPKTKELNNLFDKVQNSKIDWGTLEKDNSIYHDLIKSIDAVVSEDEKSKNPAHASFVGNLDEVKRIINDVIDEQGKLRKTLIEKVAVENAFIYSALNSTFRADFVNNAKFYINLDLGYAYVGRVDRGMAYSGFNFYLRPVDKNVPLKNNLQNFWDYMGVRTSILMGISMSSIEKQGIRKGLVGDKALVLGMGFRIIPMLKINGGWFCHYRYDQNPVIDPETYHFSMSPFVSFSLDLDIKPLISGLGDSIFK